MKEQEKTLKKKMKQINNLPHREFIALVIRMFTELVKIMENTVNILTRD